MSLIEVTKTAAAMDQLDKAIELWFADDNAIAIHTLACSAYQIIHDLNAKNGETGLIYNNDLIKAEFQKDVNRRIKSEYNFFKHADKDWNDTIEFETDNSVFFIVYSCLGLEKLGVEYTKTMRIFINYYLIMHPETTTESYQETVRKLINDSIERIYDIPKIDFYNYYKEGFD